MTSIKVIDCKHTYHRKLENKQKNINTIWLLKEVLPNTRIGGLWMATHTNITFKIVSHNDKKTLLIDDMEKFLYINKMTNKKFVKTCVITIRNKKYKLLKNEYYIS